MSPTLYRRGAVSTAGLKRDSDVVYYNSFGNAHVERTKGSNGRLLTRVDDIKLTEKGPWQLAVRRRPIPVHRGQSLTLSFRAKADAPRPCTVCFHSIRPQKDAVQLLLHLELETEWREYTFELTAVNDDDDCALELQMGMSDIPFEFEEFVRKSDGRVVTAGPWVPGKSNARQRPMHTDARAGTQSY